ncbi:hypothetical protein MMUR_35780 [Mycolicibacterium murale]|uniref:Uncharacterized protein n=1 Tax=Mycolicibacterium murale TaxID=182220 RepID=A0A7I9WNW7_9MYCO|nr:hypothetical protein MMUR_35780 [Mycolicibacterium murale]
MWIRDPPMPPERERGTFDAAPQQSAAQMAVKAPQSVHIHGALVNPSDLHHLLLSDSAMSIVKGLIQQRQIVTH